MLTKPFQRAANMLTVSMFIFRVAGHLWISINTGGQWCSDPYMEELANVACILHRNGLCLFLVKCCRKPLYGMAGTVLHARACVYF